MTHGYNLIHQDSFEESLAAFARANYALRLDPALHGRPLKVKLQARDDAAHFNVQIWKIERGEVRPRALTSQPDAVPQNADGSRTHVYVIPSVDASAYDRLAIIITRLDPDETTDPAGSYTITLESQG